MKETYCVVLTEYDSKNKIAKHHIDYYEKSRFKTVISGSISNCLNEYDAYIHGLIEAYSFYGDIIYIVNFIPRDEDIENIRVIVSNNFSIKILKSQITSITKKDKDNNVKFESKLKQNFKNNETYLFIQKINLIGGLYKYLVYVIKNGIIIDKFTSLYREDLNKIYENNTTIKKEVKKSIIKHGILNSILEKLSTKNYFNYDIKICIGGETMSKLLNTEFPLLKFDYEKYMSSKWLIKLMNSSLNKEMKNIHE